MHTTVWTGQQMIVWGGSDGSTQLSDGAAYNPTTGHWSSLPAAGAPTARYMHSSIWTGSEMIVWGGVGCSYDANGGPQPCSNGGAYSPVTNRWRAISSQATPEPSGGAVAVWADKKMLVWGGGTSPGGGVYDPATDAWVPMATAGQPAPRDSHLSLWTGKELLVWGGLVAENDTFDGGRFSLSP
jgi:N-acetylneuraminic acid mutarotase